MKTKNQETRNITEKEEASERFSLATKSLSESGRGSAFTLLGAIMTLNFSGVYGNSLWGKWLSIVSLVCLVVYFVIDLMQYILPLHASKKRIDFLHSTEEAKSDIDKKKWRIFYKSYRILIAKIIILFLVILMFFSLVVASI